MGLGRGSRVRANNTCTSSSALLYGVSATVTGAATSSSKYAVAGDASGAAGTNIGVYGKAAGATTNYAGYFTLPAGAVTAAHYGTYIENLNTNTTTDGTAKYGLYVTSTGSFTGSTGAATTNYGIYATATGADTNWAGYFSGNVNVENTISMNYSSVTVTAGATLTPTRSYHRLSATSAVTLSATTAIATGVDGQILILRGYSDTNTITINNAANTVLGAASRTLGLYDTLTLIYDAFSGIWIELSFSNN